MKKKTGLVSQHLEGIKFSALEDYQQIIRNYIRKQEGVHGLYKKGRLYYVGLASDLKWRLSAHLKDRHKEQWDTFSVYLTVNNQYLKELESLMLRVIRPMPKGNKQLGKFPISQNLLRHFKRDIKENQKKRLRELIGLPPKQLKRGRDQVDGLLAEYVQRAGKSLRLRAVYRSEE